MTDFENATDFALYAMAYRLANPPKKQRKRKYDIDAIREMRMSGMTITEIAEKVGTTRDAIRNLLSRNGVLLYGANAMKYDIEEVTALRQAGATHEEIAEKYGTTTKAIKSFCWRNHITKGE